MATVTQDKYSPYPRVCDVCGQLRSIDTMRKLDGITWVCDKHTQERTRIMLDVLNAHARPPQTWPVKNPRPQNPEYPNTLLVDEGALFAFLSRQVAAQCQYEQVTSGASALTSFGGSVPALSWAARYFYDLIQQNDPTRVLLIQQAKVLLRSCADFLLTKQRGSPTGLVPTATRATDAFYGGFFESTDWKTLNTSSSGLALLFAYRVLGDLKYIVGARAAASYLRNVQAIGSNGTNFTSSDSGGTARLYTGSLTRRVANVAGFFSDHRFFPNGLLALEFWNELKTTDGDQSIGATAAVTGFTSTPAQLLSQSITDLRACWNVGITDATGALINGLSSSTPREFFNAYPATKPQFPALPGTGMWEFADGNASSGTQITTQPWAIGLSSLYNYEGASTQVATLSDWLRSFTSNAAFETPADTSTSALYHASTGTYDPTVSPASLLTVRDSANSFAAIKTNGSSQYDWGAFGLLSRVWASRNTTSFLASRLIPLSAVQRFYDGTPSDANNVDRISLRGTSGLSMQSGVLNDIGVMANDAVLAAQFGRSYREART